MWAYKAERLLVDVKIATSSSDAEEITGKEKQVDLPHLVVGKVLENLKFKDLLQCSFVNKIWNYEARRLLREKHKCALIVDLDKPAAEEIIKLKTTLGASEWPLPYGSLSIRKKSKFLMLNKKPNIVGPKSWTSKERKLVESDIKFIILRAGPFKIVQLDICSGSDTSVETHIIRNLLADVQKTVNVLIVKNLDGGDVFENAIRLPELKKLEIYVHARISYRDVRTIKNVLKDSEKLQTVGRMSSSLLWLLDTIPPARKLAVVKEFTCADIRLDLRRAAEFAELETQLENLCIPSIPWLPYSPYGRNELEETRSISMSLLLSSRASLIELQVTYAMLQQIRREKPFVLFENVRCLTVEVPRNMLREDLERNQTIIALFPKLEDLLVIMEKLEAPRQRFCIRVRRQIAPRPVYDLFDED